MALLKVCMILQCKEVPYFILLGISCWISISGLPFGSTIPAPPSTQDLHRDGEGGQTHRMGNNTSLLELSLPLNNWANPCCKIGGKFGL